MSLESFLFSKVAFSLVYPLKVMICQLIKTSPSNLSSLLMLLQQRFSDHVMTQ